MAKSKRSKAESADTEPSWGGEDSSTEAELDSAPEGEDVSTADTQEAEVVDADVVDADVVDVSVPPPLHVPLRERDTRFASPRVAIPVDRQDKGAATTRPSFDELRETARAFPLVRIRVRLRAGISSPQRTAGMVLTHEWKECDIRYVRDKGEAALRALAENPDIELQPAG